MESKYEIERKFLVRYPDLSELKIVKTMDICQTYLGNGKKGQQRRVRKIITDGTELTYVYTEKVLISDITREELEYEITPEEYRDLLKQQRTDSVPVEKIRYCFEYKNQIFELDTYPFSEELAILEIELADPEQEIFFPPDVTVVKEVTGNESYTNAVLAKRGAFPE